MKILHVISGISRDSGGPSRSSQGLVAAECCAGVDAWIYPFDGAEPWIEGVRKFRVKSLEFRVQSRGQGIRPLRVLATHRDASKPSDCEAELGVRGQGEDSLELGVEDLKGFDLVHIHGIWDPRLHNVAKMCRAAKVPYIIAPRGMLEPWSLKQKWLKKRIARFLYQDKDLKCAAALHATAESEAEQFRKLGFRNPVVISPNGVNLPKEGAVSGQGIRPSRVLATHRDASKPSDREAELGVRSQERRVLFVSRMHPKKGVLELVEAWGRLVRSLKFRVQSSEVEKEGGLELGDNSKLTTLNSKLNNWVCELVYTLNGEFEREYEAKVKSRILELGMSYQDTDGSIHKPEIEKSSNSDVHLHLSSSPHFIFTGPLNDDAKWDAYDRADLFVLPTYSENFGIVVAEALWARVPVVTTKGTPWSELEEYKCGKWIDLPAEGSNPSTWEALDEALVSVMAMSDAERGEMGKRGKKLVEEKYTWDAVCKAMVRGYESCLV